MTSVSSAKIEEGMQRWEKDLPTIIVVLRHRTSIIEMWRYSSMMAYCTAAYQQSTIAKDTICQHRASFGKVHHISCLGSNNQSVMLFSRGSLALLAVVGAFVAPSDAWMGQKDAVTRKPFVTEKAEPNMVQDLNKHVLNFGFGCFLAAATSFAALGGPAPALADAGKFSYDPALGGPQSWSKLAVEGNQCNGKKQSPIAIRPTGCNLGANYELKVGARL